MWNNKGGKRGEGKREKKGKREKGGENYMGYLPETVRSYPNKIP